MPNENVRAEDSTHSPGNAYPEFFPNNFFIMTNKMFPETRAKIHLISLSKGKQQKEVESETSEKVKVGMSLR